MIFDEELFISILSAEYAYHIHSHSFRVLKQHVRSRIKNRRNSYHKAPRRFSGKDLDETGKAGKTGT